MKPMGLILCYPIKSRMVAHACYQAKGNSNSQTPKAVQIPRNPCCSVWKPQYPQFCTDGPRGPAAGLWSTSEAGFCISKGVQPQQDRHSHSQEPGQAPHCAVSALPAGGLPLRGAATLGDGLSPPKDSTDPPKEYLS